VNEDMNPRRKPMTSLTLFGRRWFSKTYGNSYCSVSIIVNGVHITRTDYTSGYGDYYVQYAREWLVKLGYIHESEKDLLWKYCQNYGIAYHYEVCDVSREKDL